EGGETRNLWAIRPLNQALALLNQRYETQSGLFGASDRNDRYRADRRATQELGRPGREKRLDREPAWKERGQLLRPSLRDGVQRHPAAQERGWPVAPAGSVRRQGKNLLPSSSGGGTPRRQPSGDWSHLVQRQPDRDSHPHFQPGRRQAGLGRKRRQA